METEPRKVDGGGAEMVEHPLGIVAALGDLGEGAVIFEDGLALLFHRHPASIKRAVERGELPRPIRLLGKPSWTVGAIVRHLEQRLEREGEEQKKAEARISKLRP